MHRLRNLAAVTAAAILAGCGGSIVPPAATLKSAGNTRILTAPLGPHSIVSGAAKTETLCPPSDDPGQAACLGMVRMQSTTTGAFPDSVNGLTPNDLAAIYGYTAPSAQPATSEVIGIVVAYDNANAESDLAVYRSYFGLGTCSSANGCFTKVGAAAPTAATSNAARHRPTRFSVSAHPASTASGWAAESDADIEMASAVCRTCTIVLSEAASASLADLASAVGAAVAAGATVVNASFGAPESPSQASLESAFEPAPVKVIAAAGDAAGQVLFPADATNVIAVAGTTIDVSGTAVSQSLWQDSAGGCSAVFGRTPYQPGWCPNRSIADVAAVADPNTGLAFYDSGTNGWGIIGGTSIAAPIVTGMFALSGDTVAGSGAQELYANAGSYLSVNGGAHVAGLGTPNGLAAF
jgi:subtilase family serine protease